jgi:signal transduction histidine kinase
LKSKREIKKRWGLTISLILFVFAVISAAVISAGLLVVALHFAGVLPLWDGERPDQAGVGPFGGMLALMMFSTLLGTALAAFVSKKALNPIRKVIKATQQIAGGNFDVRVEISGIYELEELANSFNKMAQELSSIETLRRDFINNLSHEFKTPIVSLRGFAKLLQDDTLPETERREYLEIMISEAERLSLLSTNILSLSKYENMEIISNKASFRLDEQIRRAVVLTEPKWSAKEMVADVEMEEINFEGSEDLTQQIWLNLIDNAVKFTDRGGAVTIRLAHWNNGVRFRIQDTGIGIDEQTADHIFDRFYQGDDSRANTGNGLGLAIVKRIVELCGGTIEVRSAPGMGSEFSVWLPKAAGGGFPGSNAPVREN